MKYVEKSDIRNYPLIEFKGHVHLIDNSSELFKCCDTISKKSIIGFDTETKPSFKKGVSYNISLIQLAVENDVFVIRIDKTGFDKRIIDILCDSNILKVGIDVKNDLIGLKKIQNFQEANFLDLNSLATEKGFKSIGAVKLCIMLLGFRISKRQRLSDWSADVLTESQLEYAAIDAWICPQILQSFRDKLLYP